MDGRMAKYYYAVGTGLLAKIENSNDIFGGGLKVGEGESMEEVQQ